MKIAAEWSKKETSKEKMTDQEEKKNLCCSLAELLGLLRYLVH
jgi:hypothetical protein